MEQANPSTPAVGSRPPEMPLQFTTAVVKANIETVGEIESRLSWGQVERLLNIIDKARQWPKLAHVHDWAMKQLTELKIEPRSE